MTQRLYNHYGIALMVACATQMVLTVKGDLSPLSVVNIPQSPPSTMTTDYVRVTAPWIELPVESPPITCEVGKHVMLIQENDEFFITMCSNEYEGVFLAAFPINTREGRSAWTTPERKMIFAFRTLSCRGKMYFRRGEELPVNAESFSNYTLRIERFDHAFPLYLSKKDGGVEFVKAPQLTPEQLAAKMAQKNAPALLTASTQKIIAAPAPRPLPSKRYIITPVDSLTNLMPSSTAEIKPSSGALAKNEKPKGEKVARPPPSRGEKSSAVAPKLKEIVQKSEPPIAVGVATNQIIPAVASSALSQPAIDKKKKTGMKTVDWMSGIMDKKTNVFVFTSLALFVVSLYWEIRRKSRRRKAAMTTTAAGMGKSAEKSSPPPTLPGSPNDFSGSIASMSLGSVTQFLNSDKEMGTLIVKDKNYSEVGTLVFIKGEIVDAKSSNKRGVDALYDILRQKEGFFSFLREEPVNVEKTITQGTISLLLDAHRIMDEEHMPPVPPLPASPKVATKITLHGNR
jgi:hypothetical protein